MSYQVKKVVPWCIEHYVRRRQGIDVEPLYRWARAREDSNASLKTVTHDESSGNDSCNGATQMAEGREGNV